MPHFVRADNHLINLDVVDHITLIANNVIVYLQNGHNISLRFDTNFIAEDAFRELFANIQALRPSERRN